VLRVACCVVWSSQISALLASLSSKDKVKKKRDAVEVPAQLQAAFAKPSGPAPPAAPAPAHAGAGVGTTATALPRSASTSGATGKHTKKRKADKGDAGDVVETGGSAGAGASAGDGGAAAGPDTPQPSLKRHAGGSKVPRLRTPEELERLSRTVFVGNVVATLTRRQLQRAFNRFLSGAKESFDELILPSRKAGAEEDEEEDEAPPLPADGDDADDVDLSSAFVPGRSLTNPVESVRLRSMPIMGVPSAGATFKSMRRACAIVGALDHGGHDTMNAYVVCRSREEATRALGANGKVRVGGGVGGWVGGRVGGWPIPVLLDWRIPACCRCLSWMRLGLCRCAADDVEFVSLYLVGGGGNGGGAHFSGAWRAALACRHGRPSRVQG
jgi:hypothetical protein